MRNLKCSLVIKCNTKSVFLSENPEGQLLKQIHGDTLNLAYKTNNKNPKEADAHWTSIKDITLGIITADCLPVFVFDLEKELILAIHAGWKGLEKYIILKSLHSLSFSQKILAFIGPHIQRPSFEIKK